MASISFDMTTEEGREAFKHAHHGLDYYLIIWELDQWLRNQHKYNNKVWAGEARGKLTELCADRHISIWD